MLRVYFGEVKDGRVVRLPYLGYSLLLVAIVLIFGLGIVMSIGAAEHMMGGDLQQAQDQLRQRFGTLAILVTAVFGFAIFFASINLMAKRIRDIGLPGWWSLLAIMLIQGTVTSIVSEQAAGGLHTLIWLALLLIPSDTLGSNPK